MQLETYVPGGDGDRLPCETFLGRPAVVVVKEHRTGIRSQYSPNGDGEGVVCDVADLSTGTIYLDVLWMTAAVRDGLKGSTGKAVAIKLLKTPGSSGNQYIKPFPLEGDELTYANQWANANDGVFDQERTRRGVQATTPAPATAASSATLPTLPGAGNGPVVPAEQPTRPPWTPDTPVPAPAPQTAAQPPQPGTGAPAPQPAPASADGKIDISALPEQVQAILRASGQA
jgi:hypothetical protein